MNRPMQLPCDLGECEFVVMAPNEWVGQWMNRQHLFSRIGRSSDVVYSNGIPYYWELSSNKNLLTRLFTSFEQDNNVIVEKPSSLLIKIGRNSFFSKIMIRHQVRNLLRQLPKKKFRVLYIFHPNYSEYVDYINYDLLIYHPYDDFSKQGMSADDLQLTEGQLVDKADIVISTSKITTDNLSKRYSRSGIETIPNGVDFAAYSEAINQPYHPDLDNIAHPRVGYIGSINRKVDLGLINYLSGRFPGVNFVLVGPIGNLGEKQDQFESIKRKKNVHFLGKRHFSELPSIAAGLDCHLICYDMDPNLWAVYAYPLKINECLATKKPVVCCDLPAVEGLKDIAEIATTHQQWEIAVSRVLEGDYSKIEKGYEYASQQDWGGRVKKISQLICDHLGISGC